MLSGALSSPVEGFGGTLEGGVHAFDLNTGVSSDLGAHSSAVRCLSYTHTANAVVSASWDKTVRLWDPRSPSTGASTALPDKAYTMDTHGNRVIVGTAGRHVWFVTCLRDGRFRTGSADLRHVGSMTSARWTRQSNAENLA